MGLRFVLAFVATLVLLPAASAGAQDEPSPQQVYRDAVQAFERGDADAYFGAFASVLRCFYGARQVDLAHVRRHRRAQLAENRREPGRRSLTIDQLQVALRAEDRVVLLERGRYGSRGRERHHQKAILMVRYRGRWRITGEGGRGSACFAELLRSETVTGEDPLASEDGISAALRGSRPYGWTDLLPIGRGVLYVYWSPRLGILCQSQVWMRGDRPRSALSCDADLERCVLGDLVLRFGRVDGRRQLVAVVSYHGRSVPDGESPEVERAVGDRDRLCELHDRVSRADPSLAGDDVWQLHETAGGPYVPATHYCGRDARRVSMAAVRHLGGFDAPLVCSELVCRWALDATGDPHVVARRENGRLRVWLDGRSWIGGDVVPRADRRRMRRERCP